MSATVLVNGQIKAKRGVFKAFREYLNSLDVAGDRPHRHGRYHQQSRQWGDYIYSQDRERFNEHLMRALQGDKEFEGFDYQQWIA